MGDPRIERDGRAPWERADQKFTRVTKGGRTLLYCLTVIQQPERARACGSGAKSSADRRPVDPPPVVELRIFEGAGPEKSDVTFGYKANFFLFATLEMARPIANGRGQPAQQQVPVLTGMPVSGMAYLDRPTEAGYFIFPDLSVRHEGKYKLSFNLYEETKHDGDKDAAGDLPAEQKSMGPDGCTPEKSFDWRLEVKSIAFTVYSAKKFPGLAESTLLSRTVAEQGCRVRIRRDVRMRRRDDKGRDYEEREEEINFSRGRPESVHGDYARSRSGSASDGEGTSTALERRNSGEYGQLPAGGHLGFIGGPGQQQSHQFAAPNLPSQQPQPNFQTPQYAPPHYQQYRQPQSQPPAPTQNGHYDRPPYQPQPQHYPQSAYPSNPPRETFESSDRRASMPQFGSSAPGSFPHLASEFSRQPHGFPPHLRSDTPVALPPLQMRPDPKYELSSINHIIPPVVSPTYESSRDRLYPPYPVASLLAADEPSRNGKRTYAAIEPTTAYNHEILVNGMRPSTPSQQDDAEDAKFQEEMKMKYKRANGDHQIRPAPFLN